MARPKINDIDKRTIQVNIRLTEAENTKISLCAESSGLTPANWIRKTVITGKFPSVKLSPIDAELYRELRKIGVNLNQITHKINIGELPKELEGCLCQLKVLLNDILHALANDRQPD
ncbi:plasmid mobilization protein [Pseudochryseolinea flava]|uniref:Bacterial mobilisation domain-containing protein n=1 Tax=Pseudochryseolinea flava TaxID=2059302 RepID=A0A364Y2J1_9BACT|nr:plasmid mobilization relaxosome protein MobC [Pseudochryseolinea flava]RAW01093.1 hypothetical protein DQQ10_12760 [Pseudochryseolinea flava]